MGEGFSDTLKGKTTLVIKRAGLQAFPLGRNIFVVFLSVSFLVSHWYTTAAAGACRSAAGEAGRGIAQMITLAEDETPQQGSGMATGTRTTEQHEKRAKGRLPEAAASQGNELEAVLEKALRARSKDCDRGRRKQQARRKQPLRRHWRLRRRILWF